MKLTRDNAESLTASLADFTAAAETIEEAASAWLETSDSEERAEARAEWDDNIDALIEAVLAVASDLKLKVMS